MGGQSSADGKSPASKTRGNSRSGGGAGARCGAFPASGTVWGRFAGSGREGDETEGAGIGTGGLGTTGIADADGTGNGMGGRGATVPRVLLAVFRTRFTTARGDFVLGCRFRELPGAGTTFDELESGEIGLRRALFCFGGAFLRVAGLEMAGVAEVAEIVPGGVGGGASAGGAAVGARGDRLETGEGEDWAAGRFGDFMRRSVPPEGDPGQENRGRTAVGVQWFWGIDSSELRGLIAKWNPGVLVDALNHTQSGDGSQASQRLRNPGRRKERGLVPAINGMRPFPCNAWIRHPKAPPGAGC